MSILSRGHIINIIDTRAFALLTLCCLLACSTSDEISSPDMEQEAVPVSLSLSVATNRAATTRMSAVNTQNDNNFRGVQDLWLVPFMKEGEIVSGDTPLSPVTSEGQTITANNGAAKFFFNPDAARMQIGTASFLAYGRATVASDDPFVNGSLTASYNNTPMNFTPAAVTFTPDVIPANRMHIKNKGPIILAAGPMVLNTCGKTTNARPVPDVTSSLKGIPLVKVMNPKMENIPMELNTSKPEFENATITALSTNFEPSGR